MQPKIVKVVEGQCRKCGSSWKIEFFSGEQIWEPCVCFSCWKRLEMDVPLVINRNDPVIPTIITKGQKF